MQNITISDLQRQLGPVQDMALKEPVSITRNGREKFIFMAAEEYHRLKRRDREVLGIEELSEEDIREIAAARVPDEYKYLDELMED